MSKIPLAVQLYSVRHDCEKDLLGSIAQVAKIGYEGVEFAGFFGHSAADIRKALDDNGLKCAGSHTGYHTLLPENFEKTVEFHLAIGCDNLIIPWIPEEKRNSVDSSKATAAELAELSEKLKPYKARTGFHVHDGDVKPLGADGKGAYHIIGENTPAEFVMQYDTANGAHGGADPVQPILDFPGRGITTHLKEYPFGKIIGQGDIPWAKVFDACEKVAGTQWYIVEHEDEGIPPMEAIAQCLQSIRAMGR